MSAFDDLMADAYELERMTFRDIRRMTRAKDAAKKRGAAPKDLRRVESIAFAQGFRAARMEEIYAKAVRLPGVTPEKVVDRILSWEFEEE